MGMIQTLRTATSDRALRFAVALGLLCLALQGAGLVEALRFDRQAIANGAYWKLLSGNFVHLGASHLGMNLAGLALVAALVWRQFDWAEWAALTALSSVVVGCGLFALNPEIGWYVGFSGTLHGLIIAGCLGDLRDYPKSAALLLVLVVAKLGWEQVGGALPGSEATAGGRVVVDAHLYGALAGLAMAPALLWHRRRREHGVALHTDGPTVTMTGTASGAGVGPVGGPVGGTGGDTGGGSGDRPGSGAIERDG